MLMLLPVLVGVVLLPAAVMLLLAAVALTV
jgi:hypothetical protein